MFVYCMTYDILIETLQHIRKYQIIVIANCDYYVYPQCYCKFLNAHYCELHFINFWQGDKHNLILWHLEYYCLLILRVKVSGLLLPAITHASYAFYVRISIGIECSTVCAFNLDCQFLTKALLVCAALKYDRCGPCGVLSVKLKLY